MGESLSASRFLRHRLVVVEVLVCEPPVGGRPRRQIGVVVKLDVVVLQWRRVVRIVSVATSLSDVVDARVVAFVFGVATAVALTILDFVQTSMSLEHRHAVTSSVVISVGSGVMTFNVDMNVESLVNVIGVASVAVVSMSVIITTIGELVHGRHRLKLRMGIIIIVIRLVVSVMVMWIVVDVVGIVRVSVWVSVWVSAAMTLSFGYYCRHDDRSHHDEAAHTHGNN